jgi:DNA polymerase-3 subunit delta'
VLAPWLQGQLADLLTRRAHALLLQGPSGLGQYDLALALAQAWLCENPSPQGPCGQCGSCHLVETRAHHDLAVLMPETVMLELGWPLDEKAADEIDSKKRKPSKEIRVDAMRGVVEFAQRTAARGRGLVVMVYPAERMNAVTANALLKTLEEPPGNTRFVLASGAAHQLLPTIRSRCQIHAMAWPDTSEAVSWLQAWAPSIPALADAAATLHLLRLYGGRPADALEAARSGPNAAQWARLPKAVARGDATALAGFDPAAAVGVLQKLCHDLWTSRVGAAPRFFSPADLPAPPPAEALARWTKALQASARTAEHPFKADLMLEDLVSQAHQNFKPALNSKA